MSDVLTLRQLAEWLKVRPKTIYNWRAAGTGPPAAKVGGKFLRFRRADVEEWLASQVERTR